VVDPFPAWLAALEARHLAELTFPELRRALQALSSLYVERRRLLPRGAALETAGKRAAFALYYGPLHFLLTRAIVRGLGASRAPAPRRLLDLGCGSGVAAAAWALECQAAPQIEAVDRSGWARAEAAWTLKRLGLRARVSGVDLARAMAARRGAAVVAAFVMNELPEPERNALLPNLLGVARERGRVLIVEPLAGRAAPWWPAWTEAFGRAGGRADKWCVSADLPEMLTDLGRAAGLDPRELTGRSLYLAGD